MALLLGISDGGGRAGKRQGQGQGSTTENKSTWPHGLAVLQRITMSVAHARTHSVFFALLVLVRFLSVSSEGEWSGLCFLEQ